MKYPTLYRTVQIDGLSIFYREAGPKDAPTLLLLHGLPSSSRMFEPLFARLGWKTRIAAFAKRTSSDHVCTDDDLGFGCEGASQSLAFFGRRESTAPGGAWKVPVEPRRIASAESDHFQGR